MRDRRFLVFVLAFSSLLFACSPVHAHPLDVAYFDISRTATGTVLTVAVHPYQAYELVRGADLKPFDLDTLRANNTLVTAYVSDRVTVSAGQEGGTYVDCGWAPSPAIVPDTELDAVADGVTVAGPLRCDPAKPDHVKVTSDIFLERFPNQTDLVRLEYPDGFAERATIDRGTRSATVDLSDLDRSSSTATTTVAGVSASKPRTVDAMLAGLAKQALDPKLGLWGFLAVLFAVAAVGALHALGPGHGKSLMAATMVGRHATYGRVLILGTVMTLTHVSDVFVMAILAGFISSVIPQTALLNDLGIISAAGLVLMGSLGLVRAIIRYRLIRHDPEAGDLDDVHRRAHELGLPHGHEHAHEPHGHEHRVHEAKTFREALWLGFLGALAPCPSAWAVFMATLSAGRLFAGIALLVAFTVGLQVTILIVGFLIVSSSTFAMRKTPPRVTYAIPVVSSGIIILVGGFLLLHSL